ncbi:MAG: FAD-dependent oxidoreductase [Spirochaetes bacterium]|nr:FAD-dependent oxidoreductase [Spirochaetota bacterium]
MQKESVPPYFNINNNKDSENQNSNYKLNNIIYNHPILPPYKNKKVISFFYNNNKLFALEGMMITSALASYGIYNIGKNHHDNSPQGLFCANGMCSQCRILVNGEIVKGCMTPIKDGDKIYSIEEIPELYFSKDPYFPQIYEIDSDVLIIGGGPAGLSVAKVLTEFPDIKVILVDDKEKLGGKLLLQTHKFFGSQEDCYAGKRGIEIAEILQKEIEGSKNIKIMTNTYFVSVFEDKTVGLFNGENYFLLKTKSVFLTSGAREKFLSFKGNHLPGIFGAGAFQTLLNRDLVKCSKNIFIVGTGNVGLIAAYHALQAGIKVSGICDGLNRVSGYKVHLDKIKRYGIPVFLQHVPILAEGKEKVENIIISECDNNFKPTYRNIKKFDVDTVLIAVGLKENNEYENLFKDSGIKVYKAGDANEIAEASSAMFSGKLAAYKFLIDNGINITIDENLHKKENILKSPGGKNFSPIFYEGNELIFPNIFCFQQIPCNPCTTVCPVNAIQIQGDPIYDIPIYRKNCTGCLRCVLICPGLAITLVNKKKKNGNKVIVSFPFEFTPEFLDNSIEYEVEANNNIKIKSQDILNKIKLPITDYEGNILEEGQIESMKYFKNDKRWIINLWVSEENSNKAASFRLKLQDDIQIKEIENNDKIISKIFSENKNSGNICICERVKENEVRALIELGISDINFIKAATRLSMGACGGKSCSTTILSIFREYNINRNDIIHNTPRPFSVEIPLKYFAGEVVKKNIFDKK